MTHLSWKSREAITPDRGFIYRDRVAGEDKGTFNNIPWDESQVNPRQSYILTA